MKRSRRRHPRVDVTVGSRTKSMRVPRKKIAALVAFIARAEGAGPGDVDVAVVDSREIAALNRRYLGYRRATDVISFDLSDGPAGEVSYQIVVCGEVAVRHAASRGHGTSRELLLYVTHGLLHLMGYDDTTEKTSERMQARQEELLEGFLSERRTRK